MGCLEPAAAGANAVNTAIHITGIVSIVMLLLSSASSTPDPFYQANTMVFAARKTFGLFGFLYAVVHLAIYFFLDREGNIASTINEVTSRRFLQISTLAILLLIPLADLNTGNAETLGNQRWNRLHKLAYLIAALVVLHYYLQVKSDTRSPIAFAIILIALLASRVPFWSKLRKKRVKHCRLPVAKTIHGEEI